MTDDVMNMMPCPFCGSDDVHAMHGKESDIAWCYCRACKAGGPLLPTQTESDWALGEDNNMHPAIPAAIRAWNNRQQKEPAQCQ